MNVTELLVHPVRLRIVHALTGGVALTASQLSRTVTGVSRATLYRQLEILVDGGVLSIAHEQRVRGAVERSYRLVRDRPALDPGAIEAATADDLRHAFVIAMTTLIAEFEGYLARTGDESTHDAVGFQQMTLWLTGDELERFVEDLRSVILPRRGQGAGPGRARYVFSPVLFPGAEAGDADR